MSTKPSTSGRVPLGYLVPLRITAAALVVFVLLQAISAGMFVTGRVSLLAMHDVGATLVLVLVLVQIPTAIVLWRPGRGSAVPVWIAVLLLVLSLLQMVLGFTRQLALHLPLGVLLFGVSVVLAAWACFSPAARRRRSAPSPRTRTANADSPAGGTAPTADPDAALPAGARPGAGAPGDSGVSGSGSVDGSAGGSR